MNIQCVFMIGMVNLFHSSLGLQRTLYSKLDVCSLPSGDLCALLIPAAKLGYPALF